MSKEELINYCNTNNCVYRETPKWVHIDKITDHLENTYPYISYDKESKGVIITHGEVDIELSDIDVEILLILKGGSNE